MDDETAEKIARNNVAFRAANDQLASAALKHGLGNEGDAVPFLCECSDRRCTTILLLKLDEYRRVRSHPRWFVHAIDHQEELPGAIATVERHAGYVMVEKINEVGEIADRLSAESKQ